MNSLNIDEYKELLFSIFNTDYEDDKSTNKYGVICVYDTLKNDKLIAIFNNATTCADFFKTDRDTINCAICRNNLRNNRYRLERLKLGDD